MLMGTNGAFVHSAICRNLVICAESFQMCSLFICKIVLGVPPVTCILSPDFRYIFGYDHS